MKRVLPLIAAAGAAFAMAATATAVMASPPLSASAVRLVRLLERNGVQCAGLRSAAPAYDGELSEAHCRQFAVATFAKPTTRTVWYQRRRREPWFPARWLVVGRNWAAWTSDPAVAAAVAHAGGAQRLRLHLPAPVARTTQLCDTGLSTCTLPVAHPVPASTDGFVYSFNSIAWDSGLTDTDTGLRIVNSSDRGTAALTGIVETSRGAPTARGPIAGLRLTLRSTDPGLGAVRVSTISDRWGAFAFTNIPTAASGSCYLITAHARSLITVVYAGLFTPNTRFQTTWDAFDSPLIRDSDSDRCPLPTS